MKRLLTWTGSAGALALTLALGVSQAAEVDPARPRQVRVEKHNGCYQLLVDGQPFYIKGAGCEFGSPEKLAQHGGNSFRTWRTENGRTSGQEVLDRALTNGLLVTMGLEVGRERHGFDYNNPAAVARQLERVKGEVLRYKDHPAMLIWCVGNELNLNAKNPKVWDAVNEISRMIHRLDPNHPTMTALAGISPDLIQEVKRRAPDLDLLGIQMYGDIVNLPRYLRQSQWTGPYIVTEWGATGHWEVGKTSWGAPIENDSSTKAEFYRQRHEAVIRTDTAQCLGSYVFLWGQKQERTPTWYGMFLASGEETATVDVMHAIWTGKLPDNRSPQVAGAWLDNRTAAENVRLKAGQPYTARTKVSDPDGDPVRFVWEVLHESTELKTGGDYEAIPAPVTGLFAGCDKPEVILRAPSSPGAYRLFVYAFDGHGHAAHANIPFFVDSAEGTSTRQAAR